MSSDKNIFNAGAAAATAGAAILTLATLLHPLHAHPTDAPAAFAEYAADRLWVVTHLGQLAGIVLIGGALLALSWCWRSSPVRAWAAAGAVGTIVSITVGGALQAVDGIALKVMVDRLAAAAPEQRALVFEATFALRQVEVGVASVLALFLGLTVALYGVAQWRDAYTSKWLAGLGLISGGLMFAGGIVQAHTGFSDATMAFSMPGGVLFVAWALGVARYLRRARLKQADPPADEALYPRTPSLQRRPRE